MDLGFYKRKQLRDYLNILAGDRFRLKEEPPGARRITEYPVIKAKHHGGEVMTDAEALEYLADVIDGNMEAILNASRFLSVIRRRERDELEAKHRAARSERKIIFVGLLEGVRRGGVARAGN